MIYFKKITIENQENEVCDYRIFSSDPEYLEVENPEFSIGPEVSAKIILIFHKNSIGRQIEVKLYIFRNKKEPFERLSLKINYR